MSNAKSVFRSIFNLKVVIPIIVIFVAAAGAMAIVNSAPKAKKRPPKFTSPTVEVMTLKRGSHKVWVPVMGTVTPAKKITLKARVSGDIAAVSPSFVPGGFFKKGERIITISPEDYELALNQVRAQVADAEYGLKVEEGHQKVSAREWSLVKGNTKVKAGDSDLALRKPHLERAKASLHAAQAQLKQAELNLSRTRVNAPFAAMVESKLTDIGASVSTQEGLATIVGTDEFWITASVPVDRLDWIDIPSAGETEGAPVRITNGGSAREGHVIRLLPSLESEGRMARLLISVNDPLNLAGNPDLKPLLLGSYVTLDIDGGTLGNVYSVPRTALRDNTSVWVLAADGTLDIRTVSPVWRDSVTVLFEEGFQPGERIITSDISAPLQGMKLQTVEEAVKSAPGKKGEEQSNG